MYLGYYFVFRMETGHCQQFLTFETMTLFKSTKNKLTKDENGGNVSRLEINEAVLVDYNIVNNDYQQDSRVLYIFVPHKLFGQLLDISPKNLYFGKHLYFLYIEVWIADQNSKPLETEDNIKL